MSPAGDDAPARRGLARSTSSATRRSWSCRASRPKPAVRIYAKLEGQNPSGSIKDRVAKAMIEAAEAAGELEPGRQLLEPTSGNTGIALALVAKLKGYPLTCVMPANATEERRRLLRLYGAEIIDSPGDEGSNGAVRLALELAESDPRYFMPFQYGNEANPRAHYEGTGAEIAEALDRVDVLVAGLGTGGTLMGTGERLRESFPDIVVAAAEPLPGDPVMGLRSLADGYVPPILDVTKLDRKVLVSNAESVAALRVLLEREGIFGGVSAGAVVHVARRLADELAVSPTGASSSRCSPTRAGNTSPPTSGTRRTSRSRWRRPSGGSARRDAPSTRRTRRSRSPQRGVRAGRDRERRRRPVRARVSTSRPPRTASTCRCPIRRSGSSRTTACELGIFHSHLSSPPRPSRTDVENIGSWQGRPVSDLHRAHGRARSVADRQRRGHRAAVLDRRLETDSAVGSRPGSPRLRATDKGRAY